MDDRLRRYTTLPAVLALIGFTSVIAQIVLMRELIVVFHGNEISLGVILANWLFWTAMGSGLWGRVAGRSRTPRRTTATLQAAVAVIFPLTILAVRASKLPFHATPGEILGPGPTFLTSFVVLSLFCAVSGCLFAAGTRLHAAARGSSRAEASSSVYLLEAAGSGVGGILASLALIRLFSALEIAMILSVLNLAAAASLTLRPRTRALTALGIALGVVALFASVYCGRLLDNFSLRYLWRGFDLVEVQNSQYGNLAVTATEDTKTFFENGVVLFTYPDQAAAEEAVHYALLQHPSPKSLALISGGIGGGIAQALQHPSLERVDYVELDPTVLALGRAHMAQSWRLMETDPRVHIHNVDGRLFIKSSRLAYDVIIVNLPDPQTAQLNRFYTVEFFRDVGRRLAPGGVFSFQVSGAENYISHELADFLRCMNKTLGQVFSTVVAIPGATIHFFAASEKAALTDDPDAVVERLLSRGIETEYVREYYVPFRMAPDRMQDLQSNLRTKPYTPINKDFTPIAYHFNAALWSTRFHHVYRQVFQSIAGVGFGYVFGILSVLLSLAVVLVGRRRREPGSISAATGFCVTAVGLTVIGLEVLLLLAFQAIYGFIYHQLALLIAAFMVGMALGSWLSLRRFTGGVGQADINALVGLQLLAVVSPLLMYAVFISVSGASNAIALIALTKFLFPLLALLSGVLGGYQFPVASRVFFDAKKASEGGPGAVYALDLAGACVGAAVISAYLIPVFGFFKTALLIAVVNLASAALLILTVSGTKRAT